MVIRKIALLSVALAVIAASAIPVAGAGTGGESVATAAAKKKSKKKCNKKKKTKKAAAAAKKKKGKCKKKRGGASSPGLPGAPLSPTPPAGSAGTTQPPPPPPPPTAEPNVVALTVGDDPILGGTGTSGQVTISEPAPSGGKAVSLQSSDPSRVSVPPSVHVAAGQTSAGFAVSTTAGATVTATITASIGTSSQKVQLTAVAAPSVTSLTLAYQCFPDIGLVNVGGNRVTLDVPAPGDTSVSLQSDTPSALAVPASVTVPDGARSTLFGVDTLQANSSGVEVTATLGTSTASDTATVRDGSTLPLVTGLTLDRDTITSGGSTTATVTLDCEAVGSGTTVTITVPDNPEVTVQGSAPPVDVVVPADQLSTSFSVGTIPGAAAGTATITANGGRPDQQQAILTIEDLGT